METAKVLTQAELQALKEAKVEALRNALKKALNRGDKHVSNIAINKVLDTYKAKGYKKMDDIIKAVATVKQAKSIDDLIYNIEHDLKAGTRTDGQKVELVDIDLF